MDDGALDAVNRAHFHPEASDRFVLFRARGGLNDTLVQLEYCRRYAVAYRRVLVADLSRCGIRLPFGEVFRVGLEFGCPVIDATPSVISALDAMHSVEPAVLDGLLSSYEINWNRALRRCTYGPERHILSFDMRVDHGARCLVHDQFGGGDIGALPLRGLMLAPAIAGEVIARLLRLGADYDALHVRHTDYRTKFRRLFARVKPIFVGRRLLLCTDSAEVQRFARTFFAPEVEIVVNQDLPDLEGEPMHLSDRVSPVEATVGQFSDLIAMARARRFLFSELSSRQHDGQRAISGYALLAEGLRTLPGLADELVSLAANASRLPPPTALDPSLSVGQRLRRGVAIAGEFVWNNRVHRKRRRLRRKISLAR